VGTGFLFGAVLIYIGLQIGGNPQSLLIIMLPVSLISTLLLWRKSDRKLSRAALGQQSRLAIGLGFRPLHSAEVVWFGLLLVLICAHLIFALLNVLQRPIFPWDAWTTWVYRTKAWFLAGGLKEIASPSDFWVMDAGEVYTIGAFRYPDMTSVYQYWNALILSDWNEQWVALSWLLLCLSITVAMYGLGRRLAFPPTLSLLFAYLLVSLPLIGIHASLAGYSDLWMAGYVGIGFGLLLVGLAQDSAREVVLGLLLCGIAVLVKKEGVVWFALALWVVWIHTLPRWWWSLALAGATSVFVVLWSIWNSANGLEGLLEGMVLLPVVGVVKLQLNDVLEPFFRNLFAMGNWNIFWYVLPVAMGFALLNWRSRKNRIALSIIGWPLLAILLLFMFSDQGAWAKDFTAINRLFLHFLPAWILAVAVIFRSHCVSYGKGGQ
jgi:hypothetical protein